MQKRNLLLIIIPIIVTAISLPVLVTGVTKLQAIDQEKQDAIPSFTSLFQSVLNHCSATTDSTCKQQVQQMQQQCSFYNNPAICSDARIQQILNS